MLICACTRCVCVLFFIILRDFFSVVSMRTNRLWIVILFIALVLAPVGACGEERSDSLSRDKHEVVALKNNLLYDAAATPNLQLEIRLSRQWSLELGAGFNPFPLDDTKFPKWRHVSAHIAPRYWFCNVFNRDFISLNVAYVHYNVAGSWYPIGWLYPQVKDSRYQGDAVMAGASYGWHFAISPHFSIELEAGVDAGYSWYDQFECKHCGDKKASGGRWLVLPKLGVNISVPLGGDELSLARRCDCEKLETAAGLVDEGVSGLVEEEPSGLVEEQEPVEESQELAVVEKQEPGTKSQENELAEEESGLADERISGLVEEREEPVVAPVVVAIEEELKRVQARHIRKEEEYEPYDKATALNKDSKNISVFFDVNVAKMDRSFIENDMLMDSIQHILASVLADSTLQISHIRIVGFASFDGGVAYNERLAGRRAQTIKNYIKSIHPQLPDSVFSVNNGGESWQELRYGLEQVTFEGRDEVLQIIDTEPDVDKREQQIKKLNEGKTYIYMRDELKPILRCLGYITIYVSER